MVWLILGVIVFFGIHLLPSFPSVRQSLFDRLGEIRYKGVYSLIALGGLVLIIVGKAYAEFVPVWEPPAWGRHLAMTLMPLSFMLLASANMPTNIKRFTRHPMLWGITLWAGAHLTANGDLASLMLFGAFGTFALFDMWSANRRGSTKSEARYPLGKDAIVVVAGLVVYGVFLFAHPYLFRVPVIL